MTELEWRSWKSSSGFKGYELQYVTPLTTPIDFEKSNYDNQYREIETEATIETRFSEQYRYSLPYEVSIKFTTGEIGKWRGYDDQTKLDIKNAELAYITVGFPDKEQAIKFVNRAKGTLTKMTKEDVTKYHSAEGRKLIEERARLQTWGDSTIGTERRVRTALKIDEIEAEHNRQFEAKWDSNSSSLPIEHIPLEEKIL